MRERDRATAERFGILDRCEKFERDLLGINGVVRDNFDNGVGMDLSSLCSGIPYIIIVPKYRVPFETYFEDRRKMIQEIIKLATKYGLNRTEDRVEDYGEHLYMVFRCDDSWEMKEAN